MNTNNVRTINDYLDSEMTKTAWVLPAIGIAITAIPSVLWAFNEVRRAIQGEPKPANFQITPMVGVSQGPEGFSVHSDSMPINFGNFGYALPGALAGAALGGLLGRSWTSALVGGALGAGAGYFLPRLTNRMQPYGNMQPTVNMQPTGNVQ